jgi:L-threonylcarbamoyladenylate synthase
LAGVLHGGLLEEGQLVGDGQQRQQFGGPLVSTSANKAGKHPARTSLQVVKQLGRDIDGLLHGRLGDSERPSRIIDLLSGQVLRG